MKTLVFVAGYLGGFASGASKAAVDMLTALLLTGNPTIAISNTGQRSHLPTSINNQAVPQPQWITPPKKFPQSLGRHYPRLLGSWALSLIQDPFWASKIPRIASPDLTVVYGFNHHLLERVSQLNPNLKRKVATVVQGSPKPETFQAAGLSVSWAIEVLSQSDFLIFASARVQESWQSFAPLAGKPAYYIPNSCPQEEQIIQLQKQDKAQLRQKLRLPERAFLAVCVGSVQYRKGQDLLLKYFDAYQNLDVDFHLYLIGPDHVPWAKTLRRAIETSPRSSYLHMLGSRNNALEYIRAADLLILPSRAEAMPLTILEAMALKTPVIASDVDGIPELIQHEQTGLLFSHEQPEKLATWLQQIVTCPDWAAELASRAHARYWTQFSRAQQFKRYHKVLNSILDSVAQASRER